MDTQNNSPSADNATDQSGEQLAMVAELGPNGLPIHPPAGDEGAQVDSNLILDTFFGDGNAEVKNPGADQTSTSSAESQATGGQTEQGPLASPSAAPAANEGEAGSQSGTSSTQPGQQQADGGTGTTQTPGQESQTSPESQTPASGLSAEDRLKLANAEALREQNEQLIERLRKLEQGVTTEQQRQSQGQPGQGTEQSGEQIEPVRLTVPDQLFDAVMNEDPNVARQGINVLVSAVATNAVQAALKVVPALIDKRLEAVTQAVTAKQAVDQMEADYYGAFPAHNNELYRPLIQQAVEEKFKQFPHAKWDADMINSVGATVNAKLTALGITPGAGGGGQTQTTEQTGQAQTNRQQQQGGQPFQRKPAAMMDGGTSTADTRVHADAGDFIKNTFG